MIFSRPMNLTEGVKYFLSFMAHGLRYLKLNPNPEVLCRDLNRFQWYSINYIATCFMAISLSHWDISCQSNKRALCISLPLEASVNQANCIKAMTFIARAVDWLYYGFIMSVLRSTETFGEKISMLKALGSNWGEILVKPSHSWPSAVRNRLEMWRGNQWKAAY